MFFLEDAEGNLVMQDLDTPQCTFLEEYVEPLSGKTYPKRIGVRVPRRRKDGHMDDCAQARARGALSHGCSARAGAGCAAPARPAALDDAQRG